MKSKKFTIMMDEKLYKKMRLIQKLKGTDPNETAIFSRMIVKSLKKGTLVISWS